MINDYEVMCLFNPEEEQYEAGIGTVRNTLFKKHEANVLKEEDMGVRQLAYPVQKHHHGHYFLFLLQLDGDKVQALRDDLRLVDSLLKVLVVRYEEKKPSKKRPVRKERNVSHGNDASYSSYRRPYNNEYRSRGYGGGGSTSSYTSGRERQSNSSGFNNSGFNNSGFNNSENNDRQSRDV